MENNCTENKKIALHFLHMVVSGAVDEAYEKFVDMNGKHHNAFFPAGFKSLANAMKENHVKFPKKVFNVKTVLGEGDLVATHSHLFMDKDDKKGKVAVHIFRFQNGKITEMWDCGMPIPENSPNQDGIF